ncbi:MAG TPA: hypothetical protein GYA06_00905 [Chloroflexi bacterium]|jgi:hypothetical protein|nr:hypothetical protein [Chloroflexota bacterium]HPO57344.1 hypothetical protein [Anaerolineaceae bacterium]
MLPIFEEKGKIFTQVIQKKPVPVVLQTPTHRIEGLLHVRPDQRTKDELDASEQFIAITDAVVMDAEGKVVIKAPFLAVQTAQIIWLAPQAEPDSGNEA